MKHSQTDRHTKYIYFYNECTHTQKKNQWNNRWNIDRIDPMKIPSNWILLGSIAYNNSTTTRNNNITIEPKYFKAIKSGINWSESRLISKFYLSTEDEKDWKKNNNNNKCRDFASPSMFVVSLYLFLFYSQLIILNRFSHDVSFVAHWAEALSCCRSLLIRVQLFCSISIWAKAKWIGFFQSQMAQWSICFKN